jgi:predicted dehydrogenase
MRLAIIGLGSIGMRHLKNALALGCDVGVSDLDLEREAEVVAAHPTTHACSYYFAPNDYDAAIIATPYDWHLSVASMFIQCRVPVFVEKPLGSLDQIEDWRRLVQESQGLVTQVGYQCRFHPSAIDMKSRGPAWRGEFECAVDMRSWPGKAYGPLLLEASHDMDLALWLGFTAVPVVRENIADVYVQFHDFSLRVSDNSSYHRKWLVRRTGECESVEWSSPESLGDQMYVDELKHFLDCVRDGKQTVCPLSDGLRVLEVCKAVEEMARQTA